MKKIVIAVIALLFLASVFVGFRAAAQMNARLQSVDNIGENYPYSLQQNYLLFHVSDLNGEAPFLVSVWGLFINYTESPHLVFVSLYPAGSDETTKKLSAAFKINRDATLPNRLIKLIEREYGIKTGGYILLDNFAVSLLETWIGQRTSSSPQQEPLSTQEFQAILSNGEQFYEMVCVQIDQNGLQPVLAKVRWKDLLPEHFYTSMTFEELMLAVNTLTSAEKIESCEVYISQ